MNYHLRSCWSSPVRCGCCPFPSTQINSKSWSPSAVSGIIIKAQMRKPWCAVGRHVLSPGCGFQMGSHCNTPPPSPSSLLLLLLTVKANWPRVLYDLCFLTVVNSFSTISKDTGQEHIRDSEPSLEEPGRTWRGSLNTMISLNPTVWTWFQIHKKRHALVVALVTKLYQSDVWRSNRSNNFLITFPRISSIFERIW